MNLVTHIFILLITIFFCRALYTDPINGDAQSDVQAPAYVPPYAKNTFTRKNSYSGSKNGYAGTKTGYTGTKTGYAGTKTGYSGTKTGYAGIKTGYAGTKTGYAGTKTMYTGTKNGATNSAYMMPPAQVTHTESKTWYSGSGSAPSYSEFYSNANQAYAPKCEPDCQNNGICVDTNTCNCPLNFHGKLCEFEKKPCLTTPPLPMNSNRRCSPEMCTITCMKGHKFSDGSTVTNMRCQEGQWVPTRTDWTSIPDCQPECSPPCVNGGVCLALNTCQCPKDFRGPQCQYSVSACDIRKISFNGGYKCAGDGEKFTCKLTCPAGAKYSSPPAEVYTCLYATGQFQPQPIPHCIFGENVIVIPGMHHENYSSSYHTSHHTNHSDKDFGYSSYSHTRYSHSGGGGKISFDENQSQTGVDVSSSEYGGTSYTKYGGNQKPMSIVMQDFTPKGGTCLTWAGKHYKTFDGHVYSFNSPCQHILVRDPKEHKYTVAIRQGVCKKSTYCPSELTIYLEDKPYTLSVGEDGSVVFRSTKHLIPIPASLPGIRVATFGDNVLVNLDANGLTIKWDTNNLVLVEGTILLWNNTEGLCGRLNGRIDDDLSTKEGTKANTNAVMASSWQLNKIGDVCDSNPNERSSCLSLSEEGLKDALQFCTKLFSKEKFRKCSKVMDVTLLLEACQWDYCACAESENPEECACNTISVYAKECLRYGVEEMKSWRDSDTCPMKCPDGKIYQWCGSDSQPTCAFPLISAKANTTCVEGCFCPKGLFLEGGKCVPKDQCPCRLRNKSFPPGSVIPKDCNTCTCQAGEWTCTKVACGARCGAVGDPHYTTFDGLRYDFMGHCTYNLLKTDNFTIEVENVACSGAITEAMNLAPYKGGGKPSCTKAVNLNYGSANIHLKQGGFILVNGKEVASLPVHIGDVLVRAASSLFIIVQLPNGVDLWWDGNTRVFVDVPPEFSGKTKGLCGTFNLNQKDDFLTPEGDVEQSALAFANKWKTREFCDDVDTKEPEHPCTVNVENKETAEKLCSKLKSKLFEECHWHVDVEPYYAECVYDMCACAGDVTRCLCPILGDYAMACAKSGVQIQWRYNVKECEVSCSGGQQYTVCADSCQRTCADVALAATAATRCKPCCVEGCACPPGQVLDSSNVCVPLGLCPCFHKGMKFDAGYKEVRPGKRERELCTCVGARWECTPASDNDIQNYPPAEDLRSNCSAANHMEFTTCEIAEPLTCKNMHLAPSSTTAECRPGCQCKKDYVLDTTSKKCVLATECPCHHGGRSYPDGHTMQELCNTCECKKGNWSCTDRKCSGVCSAWGDSHISTFDGTDYDFEGVCSYLLAKGVKDGSDGFDVEMQNVPCGTTGATCSKSLTFKVGSGVNTEIVSLTKDAPLPDLSKLKRIKLRLAGAYVFLDVPSLGVSVQWDRALRVYVIIDSMWQARVKGLCGNYNGDMRDDFQTPSGGGMAESSPLIFADSWKLKSTCPKPLAVRDHCAQRMERKEWAVSTCGALKRFPFTLCHSEVPPSAFVERCERDACACDAGDDCACACAALAAYATRCARRGVHFKWRTQELCPMQCDEECSNYNECLPACPLETCDNTVYYDEIKNICEHDTCVEGCKPKKECPEGTVYSNSSMVECVARARCRPVCMTLPDGTEVLEGQVVEEDACHSCRCSKHTKICSGQPCPTDVTLVPTISAPLVVSPRPHDEPLKCVPGWTEWTSRNVPEIDVTGLSVDTEPLPEPKQMKIGSSMCKQDEMKKIECRTINGHKAPKETGLDVECSLERGLVCKDSKSCPDFEIRVFCECKEEPFQCLNADHPNYPHPTNCKQFYECTPDLLNPQMPHTVLKDCGDGTLYNPITMVCDWPAVVFVVRPECANDTKESRMLDMTTVTPTTATWATVTVPSTASPTTVSVCPPGAVYSACAFPCDQLCDYFSSVLRSNGKCKPGQKCLEGCVDEKVAKTKCEPGSMWRDEKTCVLIKDCTCYSNGTIIKPGGVVRDGCEKCQCLDNAMHCDSTDCITTKTPEEIPELPAVTVHYNSVQNPHPAPLLIKTTVTPPPECSPERYMDIMWGDEPLAESAFSASSVASALFEPQYAVLNGHPLDITSGSWNPKVSDKNQYIQVELPRKEPIYGIMMQGSPLFDQYVTSYEVMYGDDGNVFSTIDGADGKPKVFRGPVNHNDVMKQMFEPPVEARVVRVRPLTWHDDISVRFELIGCNETASTAVPTVTAPTTLATYAPTLPPLVCTDALGLETGLPIENIEVSSNNDARKYFDMNADRGWKPTYSTPGEWIMFDFTSPRNITGIKTKGGVHGWVTSYNIMYSSDLSTFNPVVDTNGATVPFAANFDKDTVVMNAFHPPLHARYLKVLPIKWNKHIEMRIEPIGCYLPYTVTPSPSTLMPAELIGSTLSPCEPCPGTNSTGCECHSITEHYFDGENCVSRDLCPCVSSSITYAVGSTFKSSNCDECVCKLGGVSDCKPVKECKCAPNLVPKLRKDTCDCVCETCPSGTRICPTSKLCLSLDKWCDGLQDCPDDERECTTHAPSATTTATTPKPATTTTVKPVECPKVECPPGYFISYTSKSSYSRSSTSDLPPPRPRVSYQRYRNGGYTKTGGYSYSGGYSKTSYSKGGYTKTGYSKGGFSKGGYSGTSTQTNQAFSLAKPSLESGGQKVSQECVQFKCVPALPPPARPGSTPVPLECSAPVCPPQYTLKLEAAPATTAACPQYICVPPPERPVYCNMTGRTFNTFDGTEYKYDVCFHILARENRFDAWTVLVRKKCRLEGCVNELLVRQDDQLILVKPNLMIEYDNYEYTWEQTSMICFQKNSFDIDKLGNGLAIKSRKYNFTVLYNSDGDVKIGVLKSSMGTVDGLCGAFDGEAWNDRSLPNGKVTTSIEEFGQSWAKPGLQPNACLAKVQSVAKKQRVWNLCEVIAKEPLSRCGDVLNLDKWRHICLEKICECADLVVNGTKRSEEECRCLVVEQLVGECLAADKDVDVGAWRMQMDCPADCPPPLVHYDCYRKRCEPTCSALGSPTRPCPAEDGQCFPGCYCPEGKLRKGDECVSPPDCLDCVCNGVGTPAKYTTFERDDLPFAGNCTYLASRDRNQTGDHKYEVHATNGPCESNKDAVCLKTVHVINEKNVVHIKKDSDTKKLLTIVNGEPVYKYPLKKDSMTVSLVNGQDVVLLLPDAHVEVTILQSMEFAVRVPTFVYANRTEGLCGVCAGYQEHLVTSNGTITDDLELYGKSWQASPEALETLDIPEQEQCDQPPEKECVLPPPDKNPCNNIYNVAIFGPCHALVEPEAYASQCEEELCAFNATDACATLERYAAECRRHAICVHWREGLCPITCERPLVYRPCVDCERTCENDEELTRNPNKCDKPSVEGCFCPEGKVRVNNTCIEPTKCFPCDANKEHYAGDQWQEDACTKCTCGRVGNELAAHVSCTVQSCTTPVCSEDEDMITKPAKPGQCCSEHFCVPKPQDNPVCDEPKRMECGFGQILKQKTTPNGCKEFACECKPSSECERIPSDNEVEILEPGMERLLDQNGCCPRVQLLCNKETCPAAPDCPQYHQLKQEDVPGKCCPQYTCELPKDKCVVTLEWEAAPKGGEKSRITPQTTLKDVDSAWLDGPCRVCRCERTAGGDALARCGVTECAPITSTEQFVVEPRPVPFACCPTPVHVACRDTNNIYKVGENWTSPYNVCESYKCVEVEDGKLEKVTTLQTCNTDCQPGWKYFAAPAGGEKCCGQCEPVACVVSGVERAVGEKWISPDFCTNYTCINLDGTLQVQSSNVTCPEVPVDMKKQYVFEEKPVPGQCCKIQERVACRDGDKIYQEGQSLPSDSPCRTVRCVRDVTALLSRLETVQSCESKCELGWRYAPPKDNATCCGRCVQDACLLNGELKEPGSSWQSADNCTTYSCTRVGEDVFVSSAQQLCPDVSHCAPEDLHNDSCCQLCREKPAALSTCVPEVVAGTESVGFIRTRLGRHGLCINKRPLQGFRECRGSCDSGTLYNNQTGSHDSKCECCQVSRYESLEVTLSCEDGSLQPHRVASPAHCSCQRCGYAASKNPPRKGRELEAEQMYNDAIPQIFVRTGE